MPELTSLPFTGGVPFFTGIGFAWVNAMGFSSRTAVGNIDP
jgi:hypothetical protein